MSKVTGELLPCPFCGGVNVFLRDDDPQNTWVECDDCQVGTLTTLGWPECVAAWNRRAALEAVSSIHEAEPSVGRFAHHVSAIDALNDSFYADEIPADLTAHPAPISKGVTERMDKVALNAGQIAAMKSNGCGYMHNGLQHFCDHPYLPAEIRCETCSCKTDAAAAISAYLSCLSHTAGEP